MVSTDMFGGASSLITTGWWWNSWFCCSSPDTIPVGKRWGASLLSDWGGGLESLLGLADLGWGVAIVFFFFFPCGIWQKKDYHLKVLCCFLGCPFLVLWLVRAGFVGASLFSEIVGVSGLSVSSVLNLEYMKWKESLGSSDTPQCYSKALSYSAFFFL